MKPRTSRMKAGLNNLSSVTEPTMAMLIAGTAAMTANKATMRICRPAAAVLARQARTSRNASKATRAASNAAIAASTMNRYWTFWSVGVSGVSPAKIRKLPMAHRIAIATTKGPRRDRTLRSRRRDGRDSGRLSLSWVIDREA